MAYQHNRRVVLYFSDVSSRDFVVLQMIEEIRRKIVENRFEFSQHALDVSIVRHISVSEVREAVVEGEVIEDYADDKYGPSCLILGRTEANRPIHIQCSHPTRDPIKIITVYEPDPEFWFEFRQRRKEDEL